MILTDGWITDFKLWGDEIYIKQIPFFFQRKFLLGKLAGYIYTTCANFEPMLVKMMHLIIARSSKWAVTSIYCLNLTLLFLLCSIFMHWYVYNQSSHFFHSNEKRKKKNFPILISCRILFYYKQYTAFGWVRQKPFETTRS